MPRPTDDEIRALGAQVAANAERALKVLRPFEHFMGGGTVDYDGSPVSADRDGKKTVTFTAYSGNANAFYLWNPDDPLPLTPEELGAALAGVMIGGGARQAKRPDPWFQTRDPMGPGQISEETIAKAIDAANGG